MSRGAAHHQSPVKASVTTITMPARREYFEDKPIMNLIPGPAAG
jgi:hypothetical protein